MEFTVRPFFLNLYLKIDSPPMIGVIFNILVKMIVTFGLEVKTVRMVLLD